MKQPVEESGERLKVDYSLILLPGYLHKAAVSFRSTGTTLSIMLKTDGTVGMKGFTGKYIKFYRDTRIKGN